MRKSIGIVLILVLTSCYQNPYFDASKKHHTKQGFQNIPPSPDKSWKDFRKWRKQRKSGELTAPNFPEVSPFEVVQPDPIIFSKDPKHTSVTWFGHSTVLVQVNGKHILTDPQFSQRASPVSFMGPQRYTALPLPIDKLPHIDFVIISHDHYDHLDAQTIKKLVQKQKDAQPYIFAPLGYERWLKRHGANKILEMDWWENQSIEGITIHNTPVQHWTRRTFQDRNRKLWSGWALHTKDFKFYFAGDSGYTDWFKKIGEKLGPFDVSAIPIGAYEPRWFMKNSHMNVEEAIQTHVDLQSAFSVGIHWGTFILTDEPLTEPPNKLKTLMGIPSNKDLQPFVSFKHGQTKIFSQK